MCDAFYTQYNKSTDPHATQPSADLNYNSFRLVSCLCLMGNYVLDY